jgi:hypothetical protein
MASDTSSKPALGGDRPKTAIEDDEFGLADVVHALAVTVGSDLSPSGYVLGVQGAWGSGKTSYVNFVAEQIDWPQRFPELRIRKFQSGGLIIGGSGEGGEAFPQR